MPSKRFISLDAEPAASPAGCMPVARLTTAEINRGLDEDGFWFKAFALYLSDEGYSFAIMAPGAPPLGDLPTPFALALADHDGSGSCGPDSYDLGSIAALVERCDAIAFTVTEKDGRGAPEMLDAIEPDRKSLIVIDTAPERVGAWRDALRSIRPNLPILRIGAFARFAVVN